MTHQIIGIGEIGTAILEVLTSANYDVTTADINSEPVTRKTDILHICFPYSESFVKEVKKYRAKYKPRLTIIYSTVLVGTTREIPHSVHSPVEGKHPRLRYSITTGKRWISYNSMDMGRLARKVWEPITRCKLVPGTETTEFLKLASTSKYGINIVWAQYMADCAKELGMDYELVKSWDRSYNKLYKQLKMPEFQKYVLDPPNGKIGGHCVVPNSILLDKQFPNTMLKMIGKMK